MAAKGLALRRIELLLKPKRAFTLVWNWSGDLSVFQALQAVGFGWTGAGCAGVVAGLTGGRVGAREVPFHALADRWRWSEKSSEVPAAQTLPKRWTDAALACRMAANTLALRRIAISFEPILAYTLPRRCTIQQLRVRPATQAVRRPRPRAAGTRRVAKLAVVRNQLHRVVVREAATGIWCSTHQRSVVKAGQTVARLNAVAGPAGVVTPD
ncbi:MAG: hypothetical protein V2I33_18940 [Kangiellaceae bacterium]|jgi:hypothetical protein|nr:hypothetical protein [Kangiellaceae bacterium]